MLRRSLSQLDKTRMPTKVYKYGYQPDPRKFVPIEFVRHDELFPRVVRPPCSIVPDAETFLEKCDIHDSVPMADFKSSFASWDELMMSRPKQNQKTRGMSRKLVTWLSECTDDYRNGRPPQYFDAKAERKYFKQFKNKDLQQRRIPELPEKYRPHQLGEDAKPLPNYRALNAMPDWAVAEEDRLKNSGFAAERK